MNALQLISEEILPLHFSDTASEALIRMNEYKVSHYPVVDNSKFVGVITEKSIYNYDS
jgi:CBS domain-containing protein